MEDMKRIVEINGIKIEVDLRTAKRVDEFKVGDAVKVLKKEYSEYKSFPGVIVGFDEFKALPTIIIAYLNNSYSDAKIEFAYLNENSKDIEVCPANTKEIPFNEERVLEMLDAKIQAAKQTVLELERKKEFFKSEFGMYFAGVHVPIEG